MKKLTLMGLLLLFSTICVYGQNRTITGKVLDGADLIPISGASVTVQGSTSGTATNETGNFTLSVPAGTVTLLVSYIGYQQQSVSVDGNTAVTEIRLMAATDVLDEVVVTALGIKKSSKALTYNVQRLESKEVNDVKDPSFVNSLTGKVAGLVLTRSSAPGGSTKAVLRGNKSINGNNNALYVVDGVPLPSLSSTDQKADGFSFRDNGDGISNINPDDIEEISVLTGAAASALYGGQAANGVILITTKKGKSGRPAVSFSSNATFDDPFVLPALQKTYDNTFLATKEDGSVVEEKGFQSWGIKTGNSAYSPNDFFRTGATYINALSVSGGTDKNQVFFSTAATNAKGLIPNNNYNRYNFTFRNTTSLFNDKLSLDARAEYVNQNFKNMPVQGQYYNPLTAVYLFPGVTENFDELKNFESFDSSRNINVQNWRFGGNDLQMQNPYWVANRNLFLKHRNRFALSLTSKYLFNEWFDIQGRVKIDRTNDNGEDKIYASTVSALASNSANGRYVTNTSTNSQVYADLLLGFHKSYGDISLNATLGGSISHTTLDEFAMGGGLDPFKVPNFFYLANVAQDQLLPQLSKNNIAVPQWKAIEEVQSVFFSGQVGYKDYLFLDLTARNDWPSNLAFTDSEKKGFFYPSAGLSAVISEMATLPQFISFFKLRGSVGAVGNSPSIYRSSTYYPISGGAITPFTAKALLDLEPERTASVEFGADLRFFENALNLSATYYITNTTNQFFEAPVSTTTGFNLYYLNAGKVENKGLELSLGYNGHFGEFSWTPAISFSFNRNKIIELLKYTDPVTGEQRAVTEISLSGGTYIKEGGSFGDFQVKDFIRDEEGALVLDNDQLPQYSNNLIVAGNFNPDYLLGVSNSFRYKGIDLSFLVDARIGGNVISNTERILDKFGASERTAVNRDAGTQAYYQRISAELTPYVYSATNVRLREMKLGYSFPVSAWNGKVQRLQLAVIGRNLWMIHNKAPFDPDVVTSTGNFFQGYEDFSMPSLRSFGASLNFTF